MEVVRGFSSIASEHANPAGSEAIATEQASQQTPVADSPLSHLRNALAVLELLELDEPGRGSSTIVRAAWDVQGRITAAVALLEAADKAPHQLATELAEIEQTNRELAARPDYSQDDDTWQLERERDADATGER